jgi:hypothetical protein
LPSLKRGASMSRTRLPIQRSVEYPGDASKFGYAEKRLTIT